MGNKDGHLQQHRKTSSERIKLHLRVNLLHLLGLARGIIGEPLLERLNFRLDLLHGVVRLRLLVHQGSYDDTEDDRNDDDSQAPVVAEVKEELDNIEDPVLKYIPHTQPFSSRPR